MSADDTQHISLSLIFQTQHQGTQELQVETATQCHNIFILK